MTCSGFGIPELGDSANLEFFPIVGYRLSPPSMRCQPIVETHQQKYSSTHFVHTRICARPEAVQSQHVTLLVTIR
jgi:hypothetical protein